MNNNNSNNRGNNNRRRGRGSSNRPQGGSPQQLNRIDSRARGNAPQMLEKYRKLGLEGADTGVAPEQMAYAALFTALTDLVAIYGEDNVIKLTRGLVLTASREWQLTKILPNILTLRRLQYNAINLCHSTLPKGMAGITVLIMTG